MKWSSTMDIYSWSSTMDIYIWGQFINLHWNPLTKQVPGWWIPPIDSIQNLPRPVDEKNMFVVVFF